MEQARLDRMKARIARISEPARGMMEERLRNLLQDEIRLVSEVKRSFIAQYGAEVWNATCPQEKTE
jgi:hypothetical protein